MKELIKYHGAGNDFIMADGFLANHLFSNQQIKQFCDRHIGIGADGFIIIEPSPSADFRMRYYNSDGNEAEMCGNGARCAVALAFHLGYCGTTCAFEASDGLHTGIITDQDFPFWQVKISLNVSQEPEMMHDGSSFVNTGVPHNVRVVDHLEAIDVRQKGAELRYNTDLFSDGANINFICLNNGHILIRTYERGVEDETLACGTGITAAALVAKKFYGFSLPLTIEARGGTLVVDETDGLLWLQGPAAYVFTAKIP